MYTYISTKPSEDHRHIWDEFRWGGGGGLAEVSCPNICSIACWKIEWFCPNIAWLFENSVAPPPPPPRPMLVRLWCEDVSMVVTAECDLSLYEDFLHCLLDKTAILPSTVNWLHSFNARIYILSKQYDLLHPSQALSTPHSLTQNHSNCEKNNQYQKYKNLAIS